MTSQFDVPPELSRLADAKNAGKGLASARYEAHRRLGDFLLDASDESDLTQRLAMRDVDEVLEEAVRKYLGTVSDPKAKLARSLIKEWKAKHASDDRPNFMDHIRQDHPDELSDIFDETEIEQRHRYDHENHPYRHNHSHDFGKPGDYTSIPHSSKTAALGECKACLSGDHGHCAGDGNPPQCVCALNAHHLHGSSKTAETDTVHLDSGDVKIQKGKLTDLVGGPPSENMGKVRELADKGNKAALFYLNVLHKSSINDRFEILAAEHLCEASAKGSKCDNAATGMVDGHWTCDNHRKWFASKTATVTCPRCKGRGYTDTETEWHKPCRNCGGTGEIYLPAPKSMDPYASKTAAEDPFHIVYLPVNQAWMVMFGDSRISGPHNSKEEAEAELEDLKRGSKQAGPQSWQCQKCLRENEGNMAACPACGFAPGTSERRSGTDGLDPSQRNAADPQSWVAARLLEDHKRGDHDKEMPKAGCPACMEGIERNRNSSKTAASGDGRAEGTCEAPMPEHPNLKCVFLKGHEGPHAYDRWQWRDNGKSWDAYTLTGEPKDSSKTAGWDIEQARKIVKEKQHGKIGDQPVDAFSASALVAVHDALSPKNQEHFKSFPVHKSVEMAFKLVNKQKGSKTAADDVCPYCGGRMEESTSVLPGKVMRCTNCQRLRPEDQTGVSDYMNLPGERRRQMWDEQKGSKTADDQNQTCKNCGVQTSDIKDGICPFCEFDRDENGNLPKVDRRSWNASKTGYAGEHELQKCAWCGQRATKHHDGFGYCDKHYQQVTSQNQSSVQHTAAGPFCRNCGKPIVQRGDGWVHNLTEQGKCSPEDLRRDRGKAINDVAEPPSGFGPSSEPIVRPHPSSVQHTAPGGGEHAPYRLKEEGGKWYVVNDEGEKKNSEGYDSREKALDLQRALYVNVPGAPEAAERDEKKKSSFTDRISALKEATYPWYMKLGCGDIVRRGQTPYKPSDPNVMNFSGDWEARCPQHGDQPWKGDRFIEPENMDKIGEKLGGGNVVSHDPVDVKFKRGSSSWDPVYMESYYSKHPDERPKGASVQKTARSLSEIAAEVYRDWGDKVNYAAKPYLEAMSTLNSINDNYMYDSGSSIVAYFLSNARSWTGETAKRVKKELNDMLKASYGSVDELNKRIADISDVLRKHPFHDINPGGQFMDHCPNCGQDVPPTMMTCPFCHADMTNKAAKIAHEGSPNGHRVEVKAYGEDTWVHNHVNHPTEEEAKKAASDLFGRWMGAEKVRVVPDSHPVNEKYVPGSEHFGRKTADSQYKSQAARDAEAMGYGDKGYWDYLDQSAQEHYDYFMEHGDPERAKEEFTMSLGEALKGNEGD